MNTEEVRRACEAVLTEVGQVIVGKRGTMEKVLAAILAGGHVLFEDYPGLAKTLMASCFSRAMGCGFKRVQFTPDLLPADITGTYILNRQNGEFSLRRGPIFTNVLLADEINRAPPKTQAALLEAMQERQVTLEGDTYALAPPFFVMATQNPIEYEGTYPLPEAQLDRFLVRLGVGYPDKAEEQQILKRRMARGTDDAKVEEVLSAEKLIAMQAATEKVHVDDVMLSYMVDIVEATRQHDHVEVGASPRGSLALMRLSSSLALMRGRDYVLPDDVKEIAPAALSHRLILAPAYWVRGERPEAVVDAVLRTVPVPKVD